MSAEEVYEREVTKLREEDLKAREMIKLADAYERNHAVVVGTYRKQKKQRAGS